MIKLEVRRYEHEGDEGYYGQLEAARRQIMVGPQQRGYYIALFVAMLTDDLKLETGLIDVQIRLLMENMK